MKYSIVYIETRPEIQERLSIGLIISVDGQIEVKTSLKKLKAAETLLSDREYRFVARTLGDMRNSIKTEQEVDYLSRYSNNLITISPIQTIDIDNSKKNRDWLYRNYVYSHNRSTAATA